MKAATFAVVVTAMFVLSGPRSCGAQVSVRGYHRSDGTYVRPHTRSYPSRSYGWGSGLPYGGSGFSGGANAPPLLLIQPRVPLDEATREWADAIRERWRLQDEARERRIADIASRRDAYFRYRSTREPKGDGTFTHAGVRYASYEAFTASLAALELRQQAEQQTADYRAAQLAAAERYRQLVQADRRDQRLRANGYSYELYPNRR